MQRPISWLATLVLAVGSLGCEGNAVTDGELPSDALEGAGPTASGGWQSAPMPTVEECTSDDGTGTEWIPLNGRELLEIPHDLGRMPSVVLVYVAFESRGCAGTLASGDVARLRGVDESVLRIENGTTEMFSLRVYLE